MISVDFKMFFDRPRVIERVRLGTKSILSKAGAFVRTRARSLIRKRNRSSEPGEAPSDHGGYLKRWLFFGFDAVTQSVVIGPLLFRAQKPTAPLLLEVGGVVEKHWRTGKPAVYHAFPYMQPAFEAEEPNFPGMFSNQIK